jgi:hypothetical protein
MAARLAQWIIFTVILALMPFIMTGVDLWTDGKFDGLFTMWQHGDLLWPKGELLIVATAIGAEAYPLLNRSRQDRHGCWIQ